jgi:nucleotide-binding universal stress UspA family protein
MTADRIHQCPCCGLRFAFAQELDHHVRLDHTSVPVEEPAIPAVQAGVVTVPIDPWSAPTQAPVVAGALAHQADLEVDIVAVPPVGQSASDELAAAVRAARAAGAPAAYARQLSGLGGVVAALAAHVAEADPVLVCMATHGRGRLGEMRLGGVSAGLVHRSPVPVLLVGPGLGHAGGRVRRVVACLDGSERADRAVTPAARLADRLSADLVLLRVFGADDVTHKSELDAMRAIGVRIPGSRPQLAVLHDPDSAGAIVGFAGDAGDTIVALGTRGRGVVGNAVLGSVARRVAHLAACPVLAVPPTAGRPLPRRSRASARA